MDSRKATPGDGDERTTENVVRLPRDWLGPREELVPMGSRAGIAETPDDARRASRPPSAASFWDEDSGSLQAPMGAPADAWPGQGEPFGREATGVAGPISPRAPAGGSWRRARPRVLGSLGSRLARGERRRAGAVAGTLAACALVALAVIGPPEGGRQTIGRKAAAASRAAPIVTATGVNRARLKAHIPIVTHVRMEFPTHHAGPAHRHRHRIQASALHPHPRSASSTPGTSQGLHMTAPAGPNPPSDRSAPLDRATPPTADRARQLDRHPFEQPVSRTHQEVSLT